MNVYLAVTSIRASESAVNGFQKMYQKNVSAVAVLDDVTGALVANFSASDLRGLTHETIANVKLPVTEFLRTTSGT